jgi:hypothetical protein
MHAGARRFAQRKLWLWLLGALGGSGLVLVAIFGLAVAVLGASFTGCEPGSEPALASPTEPTPSAYALQSIPPERLRLYEQAGTRFDIDWSFLASIGAQECGNGDCAGTNTSGCAGPMQIAYVRGSACSPGNGPTLWERYAVNADPGRPLSINDPADAIYTAARLLGEDMGAPPTGGGFAEYRQAACRYYGACADASVSYAEEVMARAVQYGFTGAGFPRASSPGLAEPVNGTTGECSATVLAPEAPGCGSTRACRSRAPPRCTGTPGHCTRGRRNTAAECSHRTRGLRLGTPCSTAPGRAKARTSGSSSKSSRMARSSQSRATTPGMSRASARSFPPMRPTRGRPPRSMGTPSHRLRAR